MQSKEAFPALAAIQVVYSPEQAAGQPDKAKYTRAEPRRPLLLDQMLLNLYLPPHGPASPMEEVSFPGLNGSQEIIDQWRPFNRGESSTDRLHELYLVMLWMPIVFQAGRQSEEYSVSVPAN